MNDIFQMDPFLAGLNGEPCPPTATEKLEYVAHNAWKRGLSKRYTVARLGAVHWGLWQGNAGGRPLAETNSKGEAGLREICRLLNEHNLVLARDVEATQ